MKGDKIMKKAGNILLGIILIIIGLIIGGNALRNNSHRHIFWWMVDIIYNNTMLYRSI